jgi:hypothetical protein
MTPAQIQAIAAMQLTQDDMLQEAQTLGIEMAADGGFNQRMQPSTQAKPSSGQSARANLPAATFLQTVASPWMAAFRVMGVFPGEDLSSLSRRPMPQRKARHKGASPAAAVSTAFPAPGWTP